MKAEIPEKGMIVEVNGKKAIIRLIKTGPCKGCSAGKFGLCDPSGGISMLEALNICDAQKGDIVSIGVSKNIRIKGFLYSFVLPLIAFITGVISGHLTKIKYMDEIGGFLFFIIASIFSIKKLSSLDKDSKLAIKSILSRNRSDLFPQEFTH